MSRVQCKGSGSWEACTCPRSPESIFYSQQRLQVVESHPGRQASDVNKVPSQAGHIPPVLGTWEGLPFTQCGFFSWLGVSFPPLLQQNLGTRKQASFVELGSILVLSEGTAFGARCAGAVWTVAGQYYPSGEHGPQDSTPPPIPPGRVSLGFGMYPRSQPCVRSPAWGSGVLCVAPATPPAVWGPAAPLHTPQRGAAPGST